MTSSSSVPEIQTVATARSPGQTKLVDEGRRALTQVFEETRTDATPETIRQIVDDIDRIVNTTRFDGRQQTKQGERDVQRAIRSTLLRFQLHKDQDLFDRVYGYVRQHY